MRPITHIVTHTSATPPSLDIGAEEIRNWHTLPPPKGNGWSDIGYHYVIRRNGTTDIGRHEQRAGAHVLGFNAYSIGVCLVGGVSEGLRDPEDNYTDEQWHEWKWLMKFLNHKYPDAQLLGHRDFPNVARACPCFDVAEKLKELEVLT